MKQSVVFLIICLVCLSMSLTSPIPIVKATEDTWTTLAPMPTTRINFGVVAVEGKIFAIGGHSWTHDYLDINEMYDPVTNTWIEKAPMPTPREGFGIAVYKNKIYVIGGAIGVDPSGNGNALITTANEAYDPVTDTWETKAPMPTLRHGVTASVADGRIYVISGFEHTNNSYRGLNHGSIKNESYDPETNTWSNKPSIPNGVFHAVSATIGDKIYVLGGAKADLAISGWSNYNQVYDIKQETWTQASPVPVGFDRAAGAAILGVEPRIFIFGGSIAPSYDSCNLTQIYNPQQDNWTYGSQMPTSRASLGVAVIDNEFYAIGGYTKNLKPWSNLNEKYTPDKTLIPEIPNLLVLTPIIISISFATILYLRKSKNIADKSQKNNRLKTYK